MPHRLFELPYQPLLSGVGAFCSTALIWLADSVPNVTPGIVELGGTIGLIGFLSYGCVTLWKDNQQKQVDGVAERDRHRKEMTELHAQIWGETRRQNEELIAVLKKLDPDHHG